MKKILHTLIASVLLLASYGAAQQEGTNVPNSSLPVSKLVLFTNGVGYFEHTATVTGDAELILPVQPEHMNDVLQTLVMFDHGGGAIRAVNYGSKDPLDRVLGSYSLDLRGGTTLRSLLTQARGEAVAVQAKSGEIRGTVLSTEQGNDEDATEYISLVTDNGIVRIELEDITSITFANEALQQELNDALAAIAAYRGAAQHGVTLRFTGEGEREVTIGYVREMPVWKASYRLSLLANDEATLQAWAILDNPTDLDFDDIDVTFVAGNPISFITNLYEPRYVERPLVDVHVSETTAADLEAQNAMVHYDAAPSAAPMMARAAGFAREEASFDLANSGFSAEAAGEANRTTFSFHVKSPVTVGRHQSVMIPLIDETLAATTIWHTSANNVQTIFDSVHLANTGSLTLPAGPVTLYEDGVFNGTGSMPLVIAGTDDLVIPFGIATDIRAQSEFGEEVSADESITIVDGVIEHRSRTVATTTYIISAPHTQRAQPLYLDIAPRAGFAPLTEGGELLPNGAYRFVIPIDSDGETFTFEQQRTYTNRMIVSNLDTDQLRILLNADITSPDVRKKLEPVLAARTELSRVQSELRGINAEREVILAEQTRIRENMGVLDATLPLYSQYVTELTEQETELKTNAEQAQALRVEQSRLEDALREAIRQFE